MTVRRVIPHEPMRPLWRCRRCGAQWPCQPARLSLLSEYQGKRTSLLIYLSGLMDEAAPRLAQLNSHQAPDLRDRFLTWARAR